MKRLAAMRLGIACTALLSMAADARTVSEDDPVYVRIGDLDARLSRMEKILANQSLLEVSNQLEALRADVRAMHNEVDQLNNSAELARKQQRDLYADLDQRMKALEGRGGPVSGAAAPGAAAAGSGMATAAATDDKNAYQTAFALMKDGKYDGAIAAFEKFLAAYPDSSLAENAQYWLGEAYYVNKSYYDAQVAFQKVSEKFPQSKKVPDALVKVGFCRYELKQWDTARQVLRQAVTQYPDSPAARLAQQRLDKMTSEGH